MEQVEIDKRRLEISELAQGTAKKIWKDIAEAVKDLEPPIQWLVVGRIVNNLIWRTYKPMFDVEAILKDVESKPAQDGTHE